MLRKSLAVVCVVFLTAILYVSVAHAETNFTYGAAFRLRHETWDDVVDLGTKQADRAFFRLRTNLWGKADFSPNLGAYLRLTNEMKYYTGSFNYKANDDRYDPDELIFDNIYGDAKNVFGLPVDLRVGRQDFLGPTGYGEYLLILDGTPNDGSRTFYFNAAKATVKFNGKNSLDLMYITDPKTDIYLPSMYAGVKKRLTASNEQGFVAYGRINAIDNVSLEPYYIYKKEDAFTSPTTAQISTLDLNTVGMRAVVTVDTWKIRAEFAHQFGDYEDGGLWQDRSGNGGYIFFGRKYDNVSLKPEFELGYVYLSGDDPGTKDKNEAWDPLFSRAPLWNELMIYTYINETLNYGGPIPGYWTNLNLFKFGLKLNFSPATALALSYQYLTAPESTQGLNPAMFSNSGKTRGHLPTAILTHKFSKDLDAMAQLEYFIPESFYSDQADNATFLRLQLQYRL
ncbi:MAG: alginate export family protein [Acidobacteriota bacterium]